MVKVAGCGVRSARRCVASSGRKVVSSGGGRPGVLKEFEPLFVWERAGSPRAVVVLLAFFRSWSRP